MQDIIKSENTENMTLNIYDPEENKWKEISPEEKKTAGVLHDQVLFGAYISAIALKKIFDGKYYLALGCQTKEEYIATMLPYKRRTVYMLYKIANKFQPILEGIENKQLTGFNSSNGLEKVQPVALKTNESDLASLGIRKLYELSSLEDENIEELIKNGNVEIGDEKVSIEEIKEMTAAALEKRFREARKTYQAKINAVTKEKNELKEEVKLLKSEKESLLQKMEEADELEKLYGPVANKLAEKKSLLIDAEEHLERFNRIMNRANITSDDPEKLQERFLELIRRTNEYYENFVMNFGDLKAAI